MVGQLFRFGCLVKSSLLANSKFNNKKEVPISPSLSTAGLIFKCMVGLFSDLTDDRNHVIWVGAASYVLAIRASYAMARDHS